MNRLKKQTGKPNQHREPGGVGHSAVGGVFNKAECQIKKDVMSTAEKTLQKALQVSRGASWLAWRTTKAEQIWRGEKINPNETSEADLLDSVLRR